MNIINRLPYFDQSTTLRVRGESLQIKPYQIVVWVSVTAANVLEWEPRIPALPALVDTGTNHNFTIFRSQLIGWAGIRPESLQFLRAARMRGQQIPLYEAILWLHGNEPGKASLARRAPVPLALEDGIAVLADEESRARHLPVLGLRALTESELITTIDGKKKQVTIRTSWRFPLFG